MITRRLLQALFTPGPSKSPLSKADTLAETSLQLQPDAQTIVYQAPDRPIRTLAVLMAIHLSMILLLRADFLTDWDSYLYTYAALHFEPISLASGRWFFTAWLGGIWRIVTMFYPLTVDSAWLIFSWTSIAVSMLNVILFYLLARRWIGPQPAIVAGAIYVSSPLMGIYGSAVMTESVAMTLLLTCLLALSKPSAGMVRAILAGIFFGIGCTIREPMFLLIPLPLGLIGSQSLIRRSAKIAGFILAGGAVVVAHLLIVHMTAENWQEISRNWSMGMARERLMMVGWLPKMLAMNVAFLAAWLAIFSPVLILTLPEQLKIFRIKPPYWLTPLTAGVVIYSLGQIANHSLVFNPRFVVFSAALMCLPASWGLWNRLPLTARRPWLIGGIVVAIGFMGIVLSESLLKDHYFNKSRAAHETYRTLAHAPDDALFISGKLTPVVDFYKRLHQRNWQIIYAGWDFSDKELVQAIEQTRQTGQKVFLVRPDFWGEKYFRSTQYQAIESIWTRYPHQPTTIMHFNQLEFPSNPAPKEYFQRLLHYLFS